MKDFIRKRIDELEIELEAMYERYPGWESGGCDYHNKRVIEIMRDTLSVNKMILMRLG